MADDPVAILVLFVGIRLFSVAAFTPPRHGCNGAQLTPEEMKALGIEGDTPRDTVATLVAQRSSCARASDRAPDNKSQREENQRCASARTPSTSASTRRSNPSGPTCAATRSRRPARQQTEGLLADLQRRLDSIGGRSGSHAGLPVGLGLRAATRPAWKAACGGSNRTTRKPAEGRNGGRGAAAA